MESAWEEANRCQNGIVARYMPLPYSIYVRNIKKEYETCRN